MTFLDPNLQNIFQGSPVFHGRQRQPWHRRCPQKREVGGDLWYVGQHHVRISTFHLFFSDDGDDRCQLRCKFNGQDHKLRDKVVDGTRCDLKSFDLCVDGVCRSAGCDHVLDSHAMLDKCFVCKGDGSTCNRVVGYYDDTVDGYSKITVIPAGSFGIEVKHVPKKVKGPRTYLGTFDFYCCNYVKNFDKRHFRSGFITSKNYKENETFCE